MSLPPLRSEDQGSGGMLTQKEIEYSVWRVSQATGMSEEEAMGYVMSTGYFPPRRFPNGAVMYAGDDEGNILKGEPNERGRADTC